MTTEFICIDKTWNFYFWANADVTYLNNAVKPEGTDICTSIHLKQTFKIIGLVRKWNAGMLLRNEISSFEKHI